MADEYKDGVWRTVSGRRIFIRKGQSLADAMKESGKFAKQDKAQAPPAKKPNDKVVAAVGKEKGCTYVHKDGSKEWIPDGDTPKHKVDEQDGNAEEARKKDSVFLPPKEYAAVCSAIRTNYGNKIPSKGEVFNGNDYYQFRYTKKDEKIECTLCIPISGHEWYIDKYLRGKKK